LGYGHINCLCNIYGNKIVFVRAVSIKFVFVMAVDIEIVLVTAMGIEIILGLWAQKLSL
jgi:hypothetical protein